MAGRKYTSRKTFSELESLSYADLRKEYTIMRDIFQKRIKRMTAAGIKSAEPYSDGGYAEIPTLANLAARRGLQSNDPSVMRGAVLMEAKELTNLLGKREGGRITAGTLSIQGQEKKWIEAAKIVEGLKAGGKEHISRSQLRKFGRFMDEMRSRYGEKNPGSERQAQWFDSLKYNTKRMRLDKLQDMWERYEQNGYQIPDGDIDLYSGRG